MGLRKCQSFVLQSHKGEKEWTNLASLAVIEGDVTVTLFENSEFEQR